MNAKDHTAYCGIYCGDCILYRNEFSHAAAELKEKLDQAGFDKYAAVNNPFGSDFSAYPDLCAMLDTIAGKYCASPCRVGGGCSGKPCGIMECCQEKGYEGCWECGDLNGCDKFYFLEPQCGDIPKDNARQIKKQGIDAFAENRGKFYLWQK